MRKARRWFLVVPMVLGSCTVAEAYVEADELTYKAVAPAFTAYVQADGSLTEVQKARRVRTVESWRRRIEEAKR